MHLSVASLALACLVAALVAFGEKLEDEERRFEELCQKERVLKLKADGAPKGDQVKPFLQYLEVYKSRKSLGKDIRQFFCPILDDKPGKPFKPGHFSSPLTWSPEWTQRFGDLDLFNELCWHEFFTRRDAMSSPEKSFTLQFEQEYQAAKDKKRALGKQLGGKTCSKELARWPGRSEFGGFHRSTEEFFDSKCQEEAKSEFICQRFQLASFSAEIHRETSELARMWCQRFMYTKWVRLSLCEGQKEKCCDSGDLAAAKLDAISVLAGSIADEVEQAIKDGVHYGNKDWLEFVQALENHAKTLSGAHKAQAAVKEAKQRVEKALGIKSGWLW